VPDIAAQMTFDFKIHIGFEISLQNNLTKTETKYSIACPCVVDIIKNNVDLNSPILLFEFGDSWKFDILAL